MYIYKIINKINGKWYIGKQVNENPHYLGSGRALKNAITKYGKECFEKIILEYCDSKELLNEREKYWISITDAVNDLESYNLAQGGEGGDLSKYIDYTKRHYTISNSERFKAAREWLDTLTPEEREARYQRQGMSRSKGWFVSKVDDPTEIYVQNIARWCEDHGVDKSMPTALNNPKCYLFQKQTKGWRIRRSNMPLLPPYENLRGKVIVDNNCKGKTWKLINGKRVWVDK
jgi:group I intron endonuclease